MEDEVYEYDRSLPSEVRFERLERVDGGPLWRAVVRNRLTRDEFEGTAFDADGAMAQAAAVAWSAQ